MRNWCLKIGKLFWVILISKFVIRLNLVICISCYGSFVLFIVYIKNIRCFINLLDKVLKLDFWVIFLSWVEWFICFVLLRGLGKLFMYDGFVVILIMIDEKIKKKWFYKWD